MNKFLERYQTGEIAVDLPGLTRLVKAFSHLPYENITKILNESAGLSDRKLRMPEEVLEDHLRWGTGGTCFSLCYALHRMLENLGFRSGLIMGDMHYGPNIHCAIVVDVGGVRYLVDPGYLIQAPVRLPEFGLDTVLDQIPNRLILRPESADLFSLYTIEESNTKWRYRVRTIPVSDQEFRNHWIHSFSLNSMETLILSKADPAGRLYFRKDRLDLVSSSRRIKKKIKPDELHLLSETFGLPADLIRAAYQKLN